VTERRLPEEMSQFFDTRADTYDAHMRSNIAGFQDLYQAVAAPIAETREPVSLLVPGCGTGIELEFIFKRAPNAVVTCVDLSANMLEQLKKKYESRSGQLEVVQASYLTLQLEPSAYDYVVAVMTFHHLLHDTKRQLYRRIHGALKPGGKYIEGDYVVPIERERELLQTYFSQAGELGLQEDGSHHIDIPFSIQTQVELLTQAGFDEVEATWQEAEAAVIMGRRALTQ